MEIDCAAFAELPFGAIFRRAVAGDPTVVDLFEYAPFDFDGAAQQIEYKGDRAALAAWLRRFNIDFKPHQASLDSIERLTDPRALCIVTGQQLSLFGGPLYTYLKISSAIATSKRLEKAIGRPIIPIFWLADEDHDFAEIATISLPQGTGIADVNLEDELEFAPPVAERSLPSYISGKVEALFGLLQPTDFSDDLRSSLEAGYRTGQTHRTAFGRWISSVFSKHGLVIAGSNDTEAKRRLAGTMQMSVANSAEVLEALENQSSRAETIAHRQAAVAESLLFFIDRNHGGARHRIHKDGDRWFTDHSREWSAQQLQDAIAAQPEDFSPNVFLRPVLQDVLLPTLAYVAGPGEMAYYAQLRQLYGVFGKKMPVVTPRHSATLIEPAIARLLDELPFGFQEYQERIEDLETAYLKKSESLDADDLTRRWNEALTSASQPFVEAIAVADATLQASAERVIAEFGVSVERLKGKLTKSLKQKEQTGINRIHRVKSALFPDHGLQERTVAGVYFMNKYGLDLWDRVIDELTNLKADCHWLIRL